MSVRDERPPMLVTDAYVRYALRNMPNTTETRRMHDVWRGARELCSRPERNHWKAKEKTTAMTMPKAIIARITQSTTTLP